MKAKRIFCAVLMVFVLSLSVLPVFAAEITPAEIDTMAIDPQDFRLHRDWDWSTRKLNPVIDWKTEVKPEGYSVKTLRMTADGRKIQGGLILVEYLDRKFVSGLVSGDDPLGFRVMYPQLQGEEGKKHGGLSDVNLNNPVTKSIPGEQGSILDYPAYGGYGDLPRFWIDFLNNPNDVEGRSAPYDPAKPNNYGQTINGFWLENSYGAWGIELHPQGIYTAPYFEFELMLEDGYTGYRDVPPSFRYGYPTQATVTTNGGGTTYPQPAAPTQVRASRGISLDTHTIELAKRGGVFGTLPDDTGGGADNPWGIPLTLQADLRQAPRAAFDDFDFFYILHAGYDESGTWQQFGQMQYLRREDIPWTLGPGPRLAQVEKFFNDNPHWVPVYAERYANGWANNTAAWHVNNYVTEAAAVDTAAYNAVVDRINTVYRAKPFWRDTLHHYNRAFTPGYVGTGDYAGENYDPDFTFVFSLPQEDWDWANAYHGKAASEGRPGDDSVWDGLRDNVGRLHSANTRYVAFAPWEAAVSGWSHASSAAASAQTTYGATGASKTIPRSTQGENDGMGVFAHEFGHIADIGDNYRNAWTGTSSGLSDFWDIMATSSRNGPFGRHAGWPVMSIYGNTVPGLGAPNVRNQWHMYDEANDALDVNVADLASSTPVVANVVARNIPLNNALYPDLGVPRYDPATGEGFVKTIRLNFSVTSGDPYFDQSVYHRTAGYSNFHLAAGTSNTVTANTTAFLRNMYVEVVGLSGTESFMPDSGVALWRVWAATNRGHSLVDSHLYDISLTDFMVPNPDTGGFVPNGIPIGHDIQATDALFKVGKSYTDTGYYRNVRNFSDAITKPGSEYRWEPRNGRPILAGDSVNEWEDPYNKLHFYVLDKQYHSARYGDFLSYKIGVRHGDGRPVVGGNLRLSVKPGAEAATDVSVGNYAKQTYVLTNTGAVAIDIVRVTLEGSLAEGRTTVEEVELTGRNTTRFDATRKFETREIPKFFSEQNAVILNDLYAIAPDETVEFDVYVKQVNENTIANLADLLTVKVSSESNPSNSVSLAVPGVTPPTEVTLNETTLSLAAGGVGQLTATVTPSNAPNKNVTWSSSNDGVATVTGSGASAEVRAISAGTAIITVTAEDGGHTANCAVTVTSSSSGGGGDTTPPSGGGTTPPPSGGDTPAPGSDDEPENPNVEITLPGGDVITLPPSAEVNTGAGNATLPEGGEVTLPGLASPFVVPPATTVDLSTGVITTTEGGSMALPNGMRFGVPPGTTIDPATGTVTTTERGVFVISDASAASGGTSDSLEFILPTGSTITPTTGAIRLPGGGGTIILPGPNGVIDTLQGAAENDDLEFIITQIAYVDPITGEVTIPTAGTITTPTGPVVVNAGAIINPYTGEITYSGADEPGGTDAEPDSGGGGCNASAAGLFVLSVSLLVLAQGKFGKKRR
jgi:hypothetical protein